MKNQPRLIRSCVIIIRLAHILIVGSFLLSLIQHPIIVPSKADFFNYYLHNIVSQVVLVWLGFGMLGLPPLASWAVFRSQWKMLGLVGLWICLPLTLLPCLYFSIILFSDVSIAISNHQALNLLVLLLPFCSASGFTLSFIACFILALCLPRIQRREQTDIPLSRSIDREHGQREMAEQVPSVRFAEPAFAPRGVLRPPFACVGLLCHLFIVLSLFFTFTSLHGDGFVTYTTGWQYVGHMFQEGMLFAIMALVLLVALALPGLIYLASLLPLSRKNNRINTLIFSSFSLSKALNITGLSVSGLLLLLSWLFPGGDLHDPWTVTHIAFVVPPVAFLLSLLCTIRLISSFVSVSLLESANP